MDLNPLDILIHIINIVVLYVLLRVILYKPVKKFMTERSERIEKQLEEGKAAEARALELRESYTGKLAEAEEKVKEIVGAGEKRAEENAEEILRTAQEEAKRIVAEAEADAEQKRLKALESLHDDVADAAVAIAGKILEREVTIEDNRALVDGFFAGLKG